MMVHHVQTGVMGTTIRPNEPNCTITLLKKDWLGVLTYLSQYQEQAASEEIDKVLKNVISIIRSFIFRKGDSGDLCLELSKQDALEFYLHLKDFQEKLDSDQKEGVINIISEIRKFLLEETP